MDTERSPKSGSEDTDLQAVADSVRRIMARFGPDYWERLDRERAFPDEFFTAMGKAGYFGTLIPGEHGGAGAGASIASVIVETINRAGGDAATINAQLAICGTLVRSGSAEVQAQYLPRVARGELRFLTVAATEPESGADMAHLDSTALRDGSSWRIDAKKILISMAEHTELMFLLVNTSEGPTLFLLDMAEIRDHVEVRPIDMITNRYTTTLFIDGLKVDDAARVGAVGQGLTSLMAGFAVRRTLAAAEAIGNARFLLDISLSHAKTRETFGRPIGQNQGVQYPLTSAYTKVEAADLMRWDALRLIEQGFDANGRSAMAKVLASEAAWETARAALTTFGGWGLTREVHVERKLRDSTVYVFNNMLLSYIAQRVLDLPKAF